MRTAESAIQSLIRRAASAYTSGPELENAQNVCARLSRNGIASTVCYWDACGDPPAFISRAYSRVLRAASGNGSDCYLSVKAPALNFNIELVKQVVDEARRLEAIIHFDAMALETVDPTFALIAETRTFYDRIGCTLPGRWRRSLTDVDRAIGLALRVRVVKGEWAGVDADETEPREGFLNVIDRLAGRAKHVAVATHNAGIARLALRRLKDAGTSCELELLYGLPQHPMLRIARDFGVRVRMYVPYGQAGLPYRLKNAVRNPRILGWFVHDLLRGR